MKNADVMDAEEIIKEVDKINSLNSLGYLLFGFGMVRDLQSRTKVPVMPMIHPLETRSD